jgi:hypothetical protein
MLDLSARNFASSAIDNPAILALYRKFPPDASNDVRSIVHICLQYAENANSLVESQAPWTMEGEIFGRNEISRYAASPLHQFLWHIHRLRLAVFYGAPLPVLDSILVDLEPLNRQLQGLSPNLEWIFLESIVRLRSGSPPREHIDKLRACQCTSLCCLS